ncbi:hypothetical protein LIA77_07806 [Sarocladium implicatum]|nr:hypothetical protein LIA77_07806 [Sarocladium implicatum]
MSSARNSIERSAIQTRVCAPLILVVFQIAFRSSVSGIGFPQAVFDRQVAYKFKSGLDHHAVSASVVGHWDSQLVDETWEVLHLDPSRWEWQNTWWPHGNGLKRSRSSSARLLRDVNTLHIALGSLSLVTLPLFVAARMSV